MTKKFCLVLVLIKADIFNKAVQGNIPTPLRNLYTRFDVNTLRHCGEMACVEEHLHTFGNSDITNQTLCPVVSSCESGSARLVDQWVIQTSHVQTNRHERIQISVLCQAKNGTSLPHLVPLVWSTVYMWQYMQYRSKPKFPNK